MMSRRRITAGAEPVDQASAGLRILGVAALFTCCIMCSCADRDWNPFSREFTPRPPVRSMQVTYQWNADTSLEYVTGILYFYGKHVGGAPPNEAGRVDFTDFQVIGEPPSPNPHEAGTIVHGLMPGEWKVHAGWGPPQHWYKTTVQVPADANAPQVVRIVQE